MDFFFRQKDKTAVSFSYLSTFFYIKKLLECNMLLLLYYFILYLVKIFKSDAFYAWPSL